MGNKKEEQQVYAEQTVHDYQVWSLLCPDANKSTTKVENLENVKKYCSFMDFLVGGEKSADISADEIDKKSESNKNVIEEEDVEKAVANLESDASDIREACGGNPHARAIACVLLQLRKEEDDKQEEGEETKDEEKMFAKYVFCNLTRIPEGGSKIALERGYHVVRAQKSHVEMQVLQFAYVHRQLFQQIPRAMAVVGRTMSTKSKRVLQAFCEKNGGQLSQVEALDHETPEAGKKGDWNCPPLLRQILKEADIKAKRSRLAKIFKPENENYSGVCYFHKLHSVESEEKVDVAVEEEEADSKQKKSPEEEEASVNLAKGETVEKVDQGDVKEEKGVGKGEAGLRILEQMLDLGDKAYF